MNGRPISRRDFLRLSALLAGGVTLLTACSQASTPADGAPAKPAEAPKPAEAAKPAAPPLLPQPADSGRRRRQAG